MVVKNKFSDSWTHVAHAFSTSVYCNIPRIKVKGWKGERVKGWKGEKVKGWKGEKVKGWKGERVKGWKGERVKGWKGERVKGWKGEKVKRVKRCRHYVKSKKQVMQYTYSLYRNVLSLSFTIIAFSLDISLRVLMQHASPLARREDWEGITYTELT